MIFFDSHCHLDMEPLAGDQAGAIERAAKMDALKLINVGSSIRGSRASIELANTYPNIWASVGLHPHDGETITDLETTIEEVRDLSVGDKVVAIGEIGLDFYNPENQGQVSEKIKKDQRELFKAQLKLAKELNIPVILHIRDAWDDAERIIKEIGCSNGVLHCFTGGVREAKKFLDLGFYIGFTGFVTFDQDKFNAIRDAAKEVPIERLLIETDAPFLAPEPYRGKTNEPAYVIEVAKKIAELKNMKITALAECTTKNAEKLFNI